MSNNIKYHVVIKDLVTDKEEGFMLMLTKGQLPISTLPAVVPKQSQGEITMGDLTNSSVFVQYSWSGQAQSEAGNVPAGPAGVKYRTPTYNYSQTLPTWSYRKSSGVDTMEQSGEIRLTHALTEDAMPTIIGNITDSVQDGNLLFVGTDTGNIYSISTSGIITPIVASPSGPISNIQIVLSGRVKSLFFITGTVFARRLLNDSWFTKPADILRVLDNQDNPYIEAPDTMTLVSVANNTINYTSIDDTLGVSVAVRNLDPTIWELDFSADKIALRGLVGCRTLSVGPLVSSPELTILFINETGSEVTYRHSDSVRYPVAAYSIVVEADRVWSPGVTEVINNYNAFTVTNIGDVRVGFEIQGPLPTGVDRARVITFLSGGGNDLFLTDCSIRNGWMSHGGGSFNFHSDSYTKVFDVTLQDTAPNLEKKPQGAQYTDGVDRATVLAYIDSSNNDNASSVFFTSVEGYNNYFIAPRGKGCYPHGGIIFGSYVNVSPPAEHIVLSSNLLPGMVTFNRFRRYEIEGTVSTLAYNVGSDGNIYLYDNKSGGVTINKINPLYDYYVNEYSYNKNNYLYIWYRIADDYIYFSEEIATVGGVEFTGEASGNYFVGKDLNDNSYTIYDISSGMPVKITSVGCNLVSGLEFFNDTLYFHDDKLLYSFNVNRGTSFKYDADEPPLKGGVVYNNQYLVATSTHIIGLDTRYNRPINSYELANVENFMQFNCKLWMITDTTQYTIDDTALAPQGYLESSIYGRYMGSILKNRIRAKVLLGVPLDSSGTPLNQGQKIRLAVSHDGGKTFNYLSTVLGDPSIPLNYGGVVGANYEATFANIGGQFHDEATFWFPWDPTVSQTIVYRIEMYQTGVTDKKDFVVKHIELQYLLNNFKEYMLQFSFDLHPKQGLLDRSIEQIRTTHRRKLDFLKEIRDKGHKVEITMPRGETIAAVPFAPPGGESDGYTVQVGNMEQAKKNIHDLSYFVSMLFKSIDDLDI